MRRQDQLFGGSTVRLLRQGREARPPPPALQGDQGKVQDLGREVLRHGGDQEPSPDGVWFTVILLLLFGGLAGIFLFHTFTEQDRTLMVVAIVKQVAFTAMFVSTAYFFIRWNNQWFQRHANEEFHLKRMELDIDRAS